MVWSASVLLLVAQSLLAQGIVVGLVINSITRDAMPGVTVELAAAGVKQITVTGASGNFRFTDLPPGEYALSFRADHYFQTQSNSLQVTSAAETRHLDVELDPATKLSGRVLDGDGKPLAGVRVDIFTRTARQGIMSFTTDKDGYFHPPDLRPGAYFLLARSNRGTNIPAAKEAPPTLDVNEKMNLASTFYPNVTDPTQAEPIQATGGELNGYDIRLRSVPVYRIRGVVRDESGNPAEKVPVALHNADLWYVESFGQADALSNTSRRFLNNFSLPDADTVSGFGGVFEFTDVGPGNRHISASIKLGSLELRGFTVTTVSRHDEDDVQLRLTAPFAVEGGVQLTVDTRGKSVGLAPVDGPMRNQIYGSLNSEGLFRINDVYPGRYKINPPTFPGLYVSEIRLGEQDVSGQIVNLEVGAPPIHLVYRADVGSVHGTVEKGANATVVLFRTEATTALAIIPATPAGKFELAGMRPGDYSAIAFARVERDVLQDPAFVQRLIRGAVKVRVEPGQSASVELQLTVWPQ
jgi:5-hydroxyisourate hydrolase-like protein (transthyretin family)